MRQSNLRFELDTIENFHSVMAHFKKSCKTAMGRIAGATGLFARDFRSKMTIVAFHRVNDRLAPDGLTCSPASFDAFCRFFAKHFRVVSLSEQVNGSRAGREMGGTLSITFDDGYLDNFEVAAPILRKFGFPGTFFVTTGFVGSQLIPPWDIALGVQPGWMTWDHLRSLVSQGFEIGSHTDTHINLADADSENVRADLAASKQKIQRELGIGARLFAYPFGGLGHISEHSRALVREAEFDCCVSCHGGANPVIPDPYRLNRIGIAEWFQSPHQFGLELALGRA